MTNTFTCPLCGLLQPKVDTFNIYLDDISSSDQNLKEIKIDTDYQVMRCRYCKHVIMISWNPT